MSSKNPSRRERLDKAIEEIQAQLFIIEELRDEIDNWKSNLEGTNLENTSKYTELEECHDALESLHDEIESAIGEADNISFPSAR